MGKDTNIQWCDSTVNPTTSCDGCELWQILIRAGIVRRSCYAGRLHEGRLAKAMPDLYAGDFTTVWEAPGRMAEAARWSDLRGKARPGKPWLDGMPRIIFVSDMSDAMSAAIPFMYLYEEIVANVSSAAGSRHVWMWLTKQPQRMAEFSRWLRDELGTPWPRNLWVGTSVTSQATTSRVKHLLDVGDDYTTRFVSAEPLVEAIDLLPRLVLIDYLIVGGESGPESRPFDVDWARRLIRQGGDSGTAVHVKQLGARPIERAPYVSHGRFLGGVETAIESQIETRPIRLEDSHGGDWDEWTGDLADLRVRELPKARTYA